MTFEEIQWEEKLDGFGATWYRGVYKDYEIGISDMGEDAYSWGIEQDGNEIADSSDCEEDTPETVQDAKEQAYRALKEIIGA